MRKILFIAALVLPSRAWAIDGACTQTPNLTIYRCPENSIDWYSSYTGIVDQLDALAKTAPSTFTILGKSLQVGTTNLYVTNAATIGIGTSSPQKKLHISSGTIFINGNVGQAILAGDGTTTKDIDVNGSYSGGSQFYLLENGTTRAAFQIATGATYIDYTSSLTFRTGGGSGATNLTLLDNGNLGVGTTNPGRPFTVDAGASNNYISSYSASGITIQDYADSSGFWEFAGNTTLGAGGPGFYLDNVGATLGSKGFSIHYAGTVQFTIDGNNAITLMPRISSQTVVIDGNTQLAINAGGTIRNWSRTKAQIDGITPGGVGETVFCNNCTVKNICVSTGTALAQFLRVDSTTIGCGTGE